MATVALGEGDVFAKKYRIVQCIAHGGMGAVYDVLHIETARHRALKVMHPELMQHEGMHERFRREARVAAQIESAYIVDVFDAGIDEATKMPFLVMELLRGEEVGKRLARIGHFGFDEALNYLWQTSVALDKTHAAHIVHRDLKPANLFLSEQDDSPPRIKILDFGIAKLVAEGGTQANATQSLGTPLYMAPEQFLPGSSVSAATDIYSLGMLAYTMLVGSPYWNEEQKAEQNVFSFAMAVMKGPQEAASDRARRKGVSLPSCFDDWFRKATSIRPTDRFPKATTAIESLAGALNVRLPRQGATMSEVTVRMDQLPFSKEPKEHPTDATEIVATVGLPPLGLPQSISTELSRGRRSGWTKLLAIALVLGLTIFLFWKSPGDHEEPSAAVLPPIAVSSSQSTVTPERPTTASPVPEPRASTTPTAPQTATTRAEQAATPKIKPTSQRPAATAQPKPVPQPSARPTHEEMD